MSQQIETQIDVTLTERNRMTAFFRLILAVPMAIFLASFSPSDYSSEDSNYYAIGFFALPVALAIIVRQIYPSYLLAFNQALLSLQTRRMRRRGRRLLSRPHAIRQPCRLRHRPAPSVC